MRCRIGWHAWRRRRVQLFAHFPTHRLAYFACDRCPARRTRLEHLHG